MSEIIVRMQRVAVIIPAYNERDVIEDCLNSLVAQKFQDFNAYVINDLSTDNTREIIARFAKDHPRIIELREYGKVGPGRARNLTAKSVDAEILAFMDADCRATPEWLEQLVATWDRHPDASSVGGPHLAPPESTEFQKSVEHFYQLTAAQVDFFKKGAGEEREVDHNPLCNVSYKRNLFLELGGFREDLFPGEDIEIDLRIKRMGRKIFFNPKALVYHHRPKDIVQFRKVMRAYGRAQGKLVRERGVERKIQILGLVILMVILSSLFVTADCCPEMFFGLLLFWFAFFFVRPRWNSKLGLWLNALSWLNGFVIGLVTKSAPPPGAAKP